MGMTLKHMKIFVEVCRQQSVTGAARSLYMSQPAVSLAIREMEEHYGQKLFERISRKLFITEAGASAYQYAASILELADEMEQTLRRGSFQKKLRIGSSMTMGVYYLPDVIAKAMKLFPDLQIQTQVNSTELLEEALLKNELDFCFVEGPVHSEHLVMEMLREEELSIVCHKEHPLMKKKNLCLKDLAQENFLLREKNSGTRAVIDSVFLLHDFSVVPLWESTSTVALLQAAAKGIGITIIPSQFLKMEHMEKEVGILRLSDAHFWRRFHVICHRKKVLSQEARQIIALLKEDLRER